MSTNSQTEEFLLPDFVSDEDALLISDANESGLTPILFIHGLWLHRSSWNKWSARFAKEGFFPVAPGWPGEAQYAADLREDPQHGAGTSVTSVLSYLSALTEALTLPPIIIGHSMGGLVAQVLAGRGLARATVAIAPTPFRRMPTFFWGSEDVVWPILRNPANRSRAFTLTPSQFKVRFANTLDENESNELYRAYVIPAPAKPLFETALANLDPWTDIAVDTTCEQRGPLLLIAGEHDQVVTTDSIEQAYQLQRANHSDTQMAIHPDAGHSLTIDHHWESVAGLVLSFLDHCQIKPSENRRAVELAGS